MDVAELYVKMGVKGSEKTVGALGDVKKSLGDVSSMSLEAKAGILAAVYALEELMSASGKTGTQLTNMSALTGVSTQDLQKWEHAAKMAGMSSQEFDGSLKAVQNAMTNMALKGQAPEGMEMLSRKVGFDPARARDTLYVLEKLREFAKSGVSPDIANSVMKSFGVSEGFIAGARRGKFDKQVLDKAPTYGNKEVESLDRANVAWSELGEHIEMAFGHFNAKHGVELVESISKITDQVLRLVEAFLKLSEKLGLFTGLTKVLGSTVILLEGANSVANASGKDVTNFGHGVLNAIKNGPKPGTVNPFTGAGFNPETVAPKTPTNTLGSASNNTTNVTQNNNFHHDGSDIHRTKNDLKKATQDFVRQNPAQRQAS